MTFTSQPPIKPGFYAWRYTAADRIDTIFTTHIHKALPRNYNWFIGKEFCLLVPAEEVEKAWTLSFYSFKILQSYLNYICIDFDI